MHLYNEKHKGGKGKKQGDNNNEDEDDITMQNSEDEDEDTESPLIEVLRSKIPDLAQYLDVSAPKYEIENSYDTAKKVPLGHLRLRIVELVHLLIKLNKPAILEALGES